jgi:RNA polymerase sigma-70 factor (ECF subfamily)
MSDYEIDFADNDKRLLFQILNGNEKALYIFYSKYRLELVRFITPRISDKNLVDELVQDIIIQFLEKARDFRYECSIKSFLLTIARNKIIDYIRKKKIKKWLFGSIPEFITDQFVPAVIDTDLENKELRGLLEKVFSLIPHDYAQVLRLKYIDSLTVKEISNKISKSLKSTESLIYRARQAFIVQYEKSEKNYSFIFDSA